MVKLYGQQSKLLVRKFSICKSAIDKGAKNLKIDLFVISSIVCLNTELAFLFFHVIKVFVFVVKSKLR